MSLLFGEATGLEEIFHVEQLLPQNLNNKLKTNILTTLVSTKNKIKNTHKEKQMKIFSDGHAFHMEDNGMTSSDLPYFSPDKSRFA